MKTFLYIILLQLVIGAAFAKNQEVPAPKHIGVLKSYKITSPGQLCSDPNTEEFMFSIEGDGVTAGFYILKPNSFAQLDEYSDGSVRIELTVVLKSDVSKEYHILLEGSNKTIGFLPVGFTPATNYCASVTIDNWSFYNTFLMTVTGQNGNAGQNLTFQSPQANMHTVQVGMGANTWQSSMGSGLWFDNANTNNGNITIRGDLQMELTPILLTNNCAENICVPFAIAKTH